MKFRGRRAGGVLDGSPSSSAESGIRRVYTVYSSVLLCTLFAMNTVIFGLTSLTFSISAERTDNLNPMERVAG
jgi:hypothetical protein